MKNEMIWRSDDLSYRYFIPSENRWLEQDYILKRFKEIDSLFIKYGVKHTVAIVAKDFEKAPELIEYIKAHPHIDVQLHCWQHDNYAELDYWEMLNHFDSAIMTFRIIFNKPPLIWFPPYNKINGDCELIAYQNNLQISNKKISLSNYIAGKREPEVINFHYWADECKDLEAALKIYVNENN